MPDPKSPGEILSDPQFQSFPLGDQLKIMRKADPNFAAMNFKDQGTVIAKSRQKSLGLDKIGEKPKDAGFFSTLGHDIASIPGSLIATGTGEPGDTRRPGIVPSIGAAQHAEFEKGREALKNKDYPGAVSGYLAGAIPVAGPMISEIGTEAGLGQYGQAGAHALELAAPAALKEVPVGRVGRALKAALKDSTKTTDTGTGAVSTFKLPPEVATELKHFGLKGKILSKALEKMGLIDPKQINDMFVFYADNHGGKIPETGSELLDAKVEWDTEYKKRMAAANPPKPKLLSAKAQAEAIEAQKAAKIKESADQYRAERGPLPERKPLKAKPADIPEGPDTRHAAPAERVQRTPERKPTLKEKLAGRVPLYAREGAPLADIPEGPASTHAAIDTRTTKEKIEAGRRKSAGAVTPVAGSPDVSSEVSAWRTQAHNITDKAALERTEKVASFLKSSGITPDEVRLMTDDEVNTVARELVKKGVLKGEFRAQFNKAGERSGYGRSPAEAREDIAEMMEEKYLHGLRR